MPFHNVGDVLGAAMAPIITATAEIVKGKHHHATTTLATGTASIPEPISPIRPTPTWTHPHPPPGGPGHFHFHSALGHFGHIVSWVAFAIFALAFLTFLFTALRKPKATRLFNWILVSVTFISTVTYYAFATGLGATPGFHSSGNITFYVRPVFYGHFVQWFFTTPLLVSTLGLLSGISTFDTVLIALAGTAAEVLSVVGSHAYHGGPHRHAFKWGWLAFSALPFLFVVYTLLFPARRAAIARGGLTHRVFTFLALWEVLFYLPYPIFLALGPYAHIVGPKVEFLAYAILDLLTQVGFGAILIGELHRYPESDVVLSEVWVAETGAYGYQAVVQEELPQ